MNVEIRQEMLPSKNPIQVTETTVAFLGTEVKKGPGGDLVPKAEQFAGQPLTEFDFRLMKDIAIGLALNQPVLIQGGSGLGKSQTVDRMCHILGANSYSVNCHNVELDALVGKFSTDENSKSGFGWKDGTVMQAVRNGGILFLDEYNFMRGDVRAGLHQVLDSILRGTEQIVLTDNHGEVVPVHPEFRLIVAQNQPGNKNTDREVLDPAQYTRFVPINLPDDLPKEVKKARALGYIGIDNDIKIPESDYLENGPGLVQEQLREIPGIQEIIEKYIEFGEGVEKLTQDRTVGADESQPIHFAFQRDFNRVMQFVRRFYKGDINDTFQKALQYYFVNRFQSPEDRARIEEIKRLVVYIPPQNASQRRGLERELINPMPEITIPLIAPEVGEVIDSSDLIRFEKSKWYETLGASVEVKPLPEYVTPEVKRNLERLGMELRFIPALDLGTSDIEPITRSGGIWARLREEGVTGAEEAYLKGLEEKYPNWHRYEGMSDSDKANDDIPRNLGIWFWSGVKAGTIDFPNLPGQWVAVETMQKPKYGETYPSSPLTTKMGLTDRFNVTWDGAKTKIETVKLDVLRDAGLLGRSGVDMQMLDALPWNLLANREGWGKTDSYELTNTEFRDRGDSSRVLVGSSDGGGAAGADWVFPGSRSDGLGFRVAVILGT